jgi:hypothetical protein
MTEEYTARELGIFRQQLVRHRSLAASIARQEEIDSTSPPLRYVRLRCRSRCESFDGWRHDICANHYQRGDRAGVKRD